MFMRPPSSLSRMIPPQHTSYAHTPCDGFALDVGYVRDDLGADRELLEAGRERRLVLHRRRPR